MLAMELDLSSLPPLPERNQSVRLSQAVGGCMLVLGIVGTCIAVMQSVAVLATDLPEALRWLLLSLVYAEAGVAVICLIGLMVRDPGEVRRSLATCLPIPPAVQEKLDAGQPLVGLRNIEDELGDRSYCVRCCVWRDTLVPSKPCWGLRGRELEQSQKSKVHHCSICGRCVLQFDHHCGVFGRCIAGSGLYTGNMVFFMVLCMMGPIGILTTSSAVALVVVYYWSDIDLGAPEQVLPLVGLLLCILCKRPITSLLRQCILSVCRYCPIPHWSRTRAIFGRNAGRRLPPREAPPTLPHSAVADRPTPSPTVPETE
eukprot:TRINITY_DN59841_c0_g1_i1.p1 TRINITY_DN59841_c0_g1~~TRINITY_DN59841_c0_g1_i1.p1  ORF type:complete len:314 (+),score=20.76 TRINITY_DN59841_c0_g1_i1:214-1155(+)